MSFGYSVSFSRGRVAAGEDDQIWMPRNPRPGGCGIVLCHGSGNPQAYVDPIMQPSSVRLAGRLAAAGVPLIAGDFGGQAWGNDTVVSRIDTAWAVLKGLYPTMRSDKVVLLGASMGGAAVAHYSQQNPSKVAGVIGQIPLWDLKSFYNYPDYAGAVRNEIAAAWGVSPAGDLPERADTLARAHLAAGIPHLCGYSSVDNIVLPAWSTAYSNAVGGDKRITDTTYGHSDQAIGGLSLAVIGGFLTEAEA